MAYSTQEQLSALLQELSDNFSGEAAEGVQYACRCPNSTAHKNGDKNPSCSATIKEGKILIHCQKCGKVWDEAKEILKNKGMWSGSTPQPKNNVNYHRAERPKRNTLVCRYKYLNPDGTTRYFINRYETKSGKEFRPERAREDGQPCGKWGLKKEERIPYNLHEITASKIGVVWFCEGEKDADNVRKLGLLSTCIPFGKNGWLGQYAEWFKGLQVVILPHNDDDNSGLEFGASVAQGLWNVAAKIKILEPFGNGGGYDVSDWIKDSERGDKELRDELIKLAQQTPEWKFDPATTEGAIDTDRANVQRLLKHQGENLKYIQEEGWYHWNGKYWKSDGGVRAYQLMQESIVAISDEIALAKGRKAETLRKWQKQSENDSRIKSGLNQATKHPKINAEISCLDSDPFVANAGEMVIHLRSGGAQINNRQFLCSKMLGTEYVADADCPLWEQFLYEITDEDVGLMDYLQRVVGYCLTGSVSEQCFFFCHGTGANGKSVFLETIRALMGTYAAGCKAESFMAKKMDGGVGNDIARLANCRMVSVGETGPKQAWNEGLIKDLTGGEMVTARFLHKEFFDFMPKFKLFMRGNNKPNVSGGDYGIWRRMHLIPFTVEIPVEKQNKDLKDYLLGELPGILNWAIEGCQLWLNGGLNPPEIVLEAVRNYRSEEDTIGNFIEECIRHMEGISTNATEVYQRYKQWAEERGEFILSQTKFGKSLGEHGIKRSKTKGRCFYRNCSLVSDEIPEFV